MNMENKIINTLKDLGVPCNLLGYGYIKQALLMILQDSSYLKSVTKDLYPDIAKKNQTTASRVERAIRHAVEVVFDYIKPATIEKYFGNSIIDHKGKPCNSLFLATVAEYIQHIEANA